MGRQAKIDSVVALKGFRVSLVQFAHAAASSIEELDMELQRCLLWLQQDRCPYWKAKVQRCSQAYTQARIALNQRLVFERAVQGTAGSCVDEREALRLAQQRLADAQAGLERVSRWIQRIDRQINQYRGKVSGMKNAIDLEIPKAIACIDRMVDALQAYIDLAPPEALTPQPAQVAKGPMQRPIEPVKDHHQEGEDKG